MIRTRCLAAPLGYLDTFRTGDQYYAIKGIHTTPELMQVCQAPTWFLNIPGLE